MLIIHPLLLMVFNKSMMQISTVADNIFNDDDNKSPCADNISIHADNVSTDADNISPDAESISIDADNNSNDVDGISQEHNADFN